MQWLQKIPVLRWLMPNLGIKRWMMLVTLGIIVLAVGFALIFVEILSITQVALPVYAEGFIPAFALVLLGLGSFGYGIRQIIRALLAPYRLRQQGDVIEHVMDFNRRKRGFKFVALGGGTGLPASLRGMKKHTSNITAVVTVADDGGSSGRLRRDLGVLPPGDIRNNIAALADEDSLLTQLFQYRFQDGDLKGHSFGNLFIASLSNIVQTQRGNGHSSLAEALVEVERVLNIQGRVLPSTLNDVTLLGTLNLHGSSRKLKVRGESKLEDVNGVLASIAIEPANALAYPPSVQAILDADVIVIGPGSLYTSILPNLMVKGIADALRATDALIIYVCNVATQPVETEGYTVAEHVMALEKHIGRGVFQAVIANDYYPSENAGENTNYVDKVPDGHEVLQRYDIQYTDLTDYAQPWRHDTNKLATAILQVAMQDAGLASRIKVTRHDVA